MKAYLIQFTTKNEESNGYAIVAALTPNEANQILRTQGKYKYVQYNIVTTQLLAEMCDCNGTKVLIEGIVSGGDSAYKIAVKNRYSGTEEEWLESLREPQRIIGPVGPTGQNGKDGIDGITPDMNDYYNSTTIDEKLKEIDKYDTSSAVNSFTFKGQSLWIDKATRVGLVNSITIEKNAGKETTTLWFNNKEFTIPIDIALYMLSAIELYALECYNITARHKAEVSKLEDINNINNYDITADYPQKLTL